MADETDVQTEAPVEAVAAPEPVIEPVAEVAAPDVPDETAPEPAPVEVDQPTSAPVLDTESPLFVRFRRLWKGGERRAAVEWAKVMNVAEDEWAALMGEFPELLDVINS